ncbi:MAG: 4-(cytidine 5'-diphospho)-2-C-methyl-D-erythritol kinase [bacterium]
MIVIEKKENSLSLKTPAKVNLFLEVLNKRPDGYHNINSLFQAVSLFDNLTFELTDNSDISLTISNTNDLKPDKNNLICRAFQMMKENFDLKKGLLITLEKNIPIAAGLAGGSSDAAATILACNILYDLKLSYREMAELGLKLGSDIPFFFSAGQALVTGRGENIEETSYPTDYHMVLVTPDIAISTAESYSRLRMNLTKSGDPFILPRCEAVKKFIDYLSGSRNDFERVHLESYSQLSRIKDDLKKFGAGLVRMSGSGPTVFGIFEKIPEREEFNTSGWGNWLTNVVRPITLQRQVHF